MSERSESRRAPWRILVFLILLAGVAGLAALIALKPRPQVLTPVRQLPLVKIEAVHLSDDPLVISASGLVRARTQVTLAAEISGRVAYVSQSLLSGGRFKRGDLLVGIDSAPFKAILEQSLADRRSAQAALAVAEQSVQRTRALIAQGFLSAQTLDERIAARDQARANLDRAAAQISQRRIDLTRASLRAPFDGQVLSQAINIGDIVSPGRELARIFASNALEVAVSLTDSQIAQIGDPWKTDGAKPQAERKARVIVDHGGRRYGWPAVLDRVEAAIDSQTRTYGVVLRVVDAAQRGQAADAEDAQPGPPMVVGMFAAVEIEGRRPGPHAWIPRVALRDGEQIWLLDDNDRLLIRPVRRLGERGQALAVAGEALTQDARLIVSELKVASPGMSLRAVEAGSIIQ